MLVELSNLVELQKLDDEIRALRSRLGKIPGEIDALEKEIASERANLDAAEKDLAEAQKARRTQEGELEAAEAKVEKYKGQLMNVKSNEEYKAMQKQIEVAKGEVSDLEDKILHGMDRIEGLESARDERKSELATGQKEVAAMEAQLDEERAKLEKELADRESSRQALLQKIPEDLLSEYEKVAKARGGIAMAEAVDEHCQVCMVRLRPQMYNELRVGDKIFHCDSCKRFLYYLGTTKDEEQPAAT